MNEKPSEAVELVLAIAPFSEYEKVRIVGAFVTLVVADSSSEVDMAMGLLPSILSDGCRHVCCMGRYAEELHDCIDAVVEDLALLDVVTTWHDSASDACEYIVLVAGRDVSTALVLSPMAVVPRLLSEFASVLSEFV
jgi:hypothetical protein